VVTWKRRHLHIVGPDGAARRPGDGRWVAAAVVLMAALAYAAVIYVVQP